MAARGPVPKRSDQRRRHNPPAIPIVEGQAKGVSAAPTGDPTWHPLALAWFQSLGESGQSAFYEPSDWATAALVAESMSRDLKPKIMGMNNAGETIEYHGPLAGSALTAYLKAMSALLATEGDRRRAAIELKRAGADGTSAGEGVPNLNDYRDRLSG